MPVELRETRLPGVGTKFSIQLDHGNFRLVPGTAGDGLLLSAPPGVDYPGAFGLSSQSTTIATTIVGAGNRSVTYDFEEVPIGA